MSNLGLDSAAGSTSGPAITAESDVAEAGLSSEQEGSGLRILTPTELEINGMVGLMRLQDLAPNPDQPRSSKDKAKATELNASIKAVGITDPLVITPFSKATWIRRVPEDKDATHSTVSGHSRREGALLAKHQLVPVRIQIFPDQEAHEDAMYILNGPREDLAPIDQARDFMRRLDRGVGVDTIASACGKGPAWVLRRVKLVRCSPEILASLDPSIKEKKRPPVTVAEELGILGAPTEDQLADVLRNHPEQDVNIGALDEDGRRFLLQNLLLTEVRKKGLNSLRACDHIRDRTQGIATASGAKRKRRVQRPSKRLEVLRNLLRTTMQSVVFGWPEEEFKRIFEQATAEDIEAIIEEVRRTCQCFDEVLETLGSIRAEKEERTPPCRPIKASSVDTSSAPKPPKRSAATTHRRTSKRAPTQVRALDPRDVAKRLAQRGAATRRKGASTTAVASGGTSGRNLGPDGETSPSETAAVAAQPIPRTEKPIVPPKKKYDGFPVNANVWDEKLSRYAIRQIDTPQEVVEIARLGEHGFKDGEVPSFIDLDKCRQLVEAEAGS